jgi:hypothetical protein
MVKQIVMYLLQLLYYRLWNSEYNRVVSIEYDMGSPCECGG